MDSEEWYKSWFDSPYYHILYKDRDLFEAERFISKLIGFLNPPENSRMLDLACGAGRHSRYLAKMGFDVYGVDLSSNSIDKARYHESDNLHFDIHDMRKVYKSSFFDHVFSLFTSLGYFDLEADNSATFSAMAQNLKVNGVLTIDFLNAKKAINNLKPAEKKVVDGILFDIERYVENGKIKKSIKFKSEGETYRFEEQVRAFMLKDFTDYLYQNRLKIIRLFGNYELDDFHEDRSDRLIIIAKKQ